jgi:phage terminase small subunit
MKDEKKDKEKTLTKKQKLFCEYYIENWNATDAAKRAGYSKKTSYSIGQENLNKPEIQSYINNIQKDLEKIAGVSRLKVLNEFQKIAFSSVSHLHNSWIELKEFKELTEDQKACISEIVTQSKKVNIGNDNDSDITIDYVKIKLHDKQKALENINKMLGYNGAEKIEQINKTDLTLSNISDEEKEK